MHTWRLGGTGRVAVDENQGRGGGRWHSAGRPLLYTADACAAAVAEFLVHLNDPPPADLLAVVLEIPDDLATDTIAMERLPADWRAPGSRTCCRWGDLWLDRPPAERGAVLRVPSAVVPMHENWLIDPGHPDAQRVRIRSSHPYTLDERLVDPIKRS